jgi:hypothetical protein
VKGQVIMTSEELFAFTALNSWKLVTGRFEQGFAALTDEQMGNRVAPGKNRILYIVGHLIAVHDRMIPRLGLGERLYPNLDEPFVTNPDGTIPDPISVSDLRNAWFEINGKLTEALEVFTPEDWLRKRSDVTDEDYAKDPSRSRLQLILNCVNHISLHSGQLVLAKSVQLT